MVTGQLASGRVIPAPAEERLRADGPVTPADDRVTLVGARPQAKMGVERGAHVASMTATLRMAPNVGGFAGTRSLAGTEATLNAGIPEPVKFEVVKFEVVEPDVATLDAGTEGTLRKGRTGGSPVGRL